MTQSCLKDWTRDDFQTLEKGVLLAAHSLGDTGLFTDDSLQLMLDNHPEDELAISTMEWRQKYCWTSSSRVGCG